ncbi:hypothetical protein HYC85_018290 [Camellia sinensis]|uniref:aspartate kinase n=1 Tax=Camellia sinensis TaxID=4442 RepID=A0A7J7GTX5_CAMSI|nr:hypothetical protein HYC85_018290 [Camellia sinensis]
MPALLISSAGSAIIDLTTITTHPEELDQLLKAIAQVKELTLRTKDYLVSFGECMSTRIFAAYLNKIGVKARQYDAFDIGFIITDDFTNADILEATYPAVAKRLHSDWISDPAIPIVIGYLGKGWRSCAVTTLGRGGSDLTATTIGKALGLQEIQDVDGVLTCDPNIYPLAEPVSHLTFVEAAELALLIADNELDWVLHPQSMRPARECDIPVRVKNSYNPKAPGTLITRTRDMSKVFLIFEDLGISVDVVATSEVGISLTLDPSKLWSRELIQQASELDHVVEELEKIAVAFCVLRANGVNVQMISQGASKVNILLIVHDSEVEQCVRALHSACFGSDISEVDRECGSQNGSVSILQNGCRLVSGP